MAWWQWGDAHSGQVVLCVHGLSRQGRDFDVLARALCAAAERRGKMIRVVCPDVVGRGKSDWLKDPQGYQLPAYAADMVALLHRLDGEASVDTLDWVGTSMGGLIGMGICGQPDLALPAPVRKLVLNDVGPTIEWSSLQRIGTYLGKAGNFASLQQAANAMRVISSSFGPHTPEQWLELSSHMVKPVDDPALGPEAVTLHYDPAIAQVFGAATEESTRQGEAILWHLYDHIKAQTLVLRGAQSDLLSRKTAEAMTQRGPHAALVEFEGVGHAPTLIAPDQVEVVVNFLLEPMPVA